MKRNLIPAVILVAIASLVIVIFSNHWYTGSQGDFLSTDFPETVSHKVQLNPESDKEVIRFSYVDDAGDTVVTEVEYTNGVTSYLFYREGGGSLKKVLDYYPSEGDGASNTERQLKSATEFDQSGEKMLRHFAYREDGTVERGGVRLPDGSYQTYYLDEKGKTVRERAFSKDEKMIYDLTFYPDGSPKIKTQRTSSEITTITYRKDGTKYSEVKNGYSSHKGIIYWENGVTKKATFEESNWRIEVEYFDENGVFKYEVEYYDDNMEVSHMRSDGHELFEQDFAYTGTPRDDPACEGTYVLKSVTEYHKFGKSRYFRKTLRVIEFADDGITPVKIVVPTSDWNRFEYTLDDNLIVIDVKKEKGSNGYGTGGSKKGDVVYKLGEKVDVAPHLIKPVKLECVEIPEKITEGISAPAYYRYGPF